MILFLPMIQSGDSQPGFVYIGREKKTGS